MSKKDNVKEPAASVSEITLGRLRAEEMMAERKVVAFRNDMLLLEKKLEAARSDVAMHAGALEMVQHLIEIATGKKPVPKPPPEDDAGNEDKDPAAGADDTPPIPEGDMTATIEE